MLSKSEMKRKLILDTTSKFITENGIHAVTLDAVAKKAGISKGGLLHHFPNKESLLKGIAEYICEEYELAIYKQAESDPISLGKWSRALLSVSKTDLEHNAQLNIGILATSLLNPDMAKSITESYQSVLEKTEHDGLDPVTATIIRLAIDGLYYSQLLNVAPLDKKMQQKVIEQLFDMTRNEE